MLNRIQPDGQGKARTEDLTPIAQELGLITTGEAHVYRVNATGTVTDVDTDSSTGLAGPRPWTGTTGRSRCAVYVGTRIPSDESSIRDAAGFIEFGDFKEQTEYGKVASEINKRVVADLETQGVAGEEAQSLLGKPIDRRGRLHDAHLQPARDRRERDRPRARGARGADDRRGRPRACRRAGARGTCPCRCVRST